MRVLLIVGGWSSEREISLRGGKGIATALEERGHRVTWLDLQEGFDTLLTVAAQHDFCFINLHGSPGEDGLVQAMLEANHCPYQGSGAAGSFLALHKAASKQVFRRAGLLTADWEFLPTRPPHLWEPQLPYPLFVKSNTGGSSLHLSRAENKADLDTILDEIFNAGDEALIEPVIQGEEVTCGILGDLALPPILIQPAPGSFFDYTSKYAAVSDGGAREIC
ncbi:MAG: D-alanine--D-alanine ligase, partial [Desulfovibrionaceae bacterium]